MHEKNVRKTSWKPSRLEGVPKWCEKNYSFDVYTSKVPVNAILKTPAELSFLVNLSTIFRGNQVFVRHF